MYAYFLSLKLVQRQYAYQMTETLMPHKVTELQWGLLRYLVEIGPATFSEIAAFWQVEKPTITPVAQKLLEQSFIEVQLGQDKRQKTMVITELGIAKYKEIKVDVDMWLTHLTEGITEQELAQGLAVFEQLQHNLKK
ncbi:MarR family transcriptional regulator [Solibacillus sp. CAU 1738]|uniref:MarR family winged helix-turn-helix transcriptional regulator n=1 Tax=Solibacillus sp. CAU 1738 TaxID=3140363 RepID=UPI0032606CF7